MPRWLTFGLLLVAAATLGGCYDIAQSVEITSDGMMRRQYVSRIDLAAIKAAPTESRNVCDTFHDDYPNHMLSTGSARIVGRDRICTYEVHGATKDVFTSLADQTAQDAKGGRLQEGLLKFAVLDDRYRISVDIRPNRSFPDSGLAGRLAAIASTTGRSMRWSVTAPHILATSEQLSDDGRTVTLEMPMAEYISNTTKTHHFYVDLPRPRSGSSER